MKLIIILGYTLGSDCSIQPILQSRLDSAISLYNKDDEFLVCGNMPPKTVAPTRCETSTEAEEMKKYLITNGIPAEKIFKEDQSTTTFGNAFYSYWNFIQKHPTRPIAIVSNQFHSRLVKYSFDKVLGNKYPYIFHVASDAHLNIDSKEILQRELIINELLENCYPKLFGDVKNGDIEALKAIIDGPRNIPFETCIRNLLNLEDSADINIL